MTWDHKIMRKSKKNEQNITYKNKSKTTKIIKKISPGTRFHFSSASPWPMANPGIPSGGVDVLLSPLHAGQDPSAPQPANICQLKVQNTSITSEPSEIPTWTRPIIWEQEMTPAHETHWWCTFLANLFDTSEFQMCAEISCRSSLPFFASIWACCCPMPTPATGLLAWHRSLVEESWRFHEIVTSRSR